MKLGLKSEAASGNTLRDCSLTALTFLTLMVAFLLVFSVARSMEKIDRTQERALGHLYDDHNFSQKNCFADRKYAMHVRWLG